MLKRKLGGKFCPNCGKELQGTEVTCKGCTTPEFAFKNIHITLCNSCHSYLHRSKWTKCIDINTAVKKVAQDAIKVSVKIGKLSLELHETMSTFKAGVTRDFTIEVAHEGSLFDIPATYEVTLCPKCSKKGTKYFESILQVRNATPEITAFIRNDIAKQKKKGIYINKESRLNKYSEENIDFSITDQTYAKVIAEKLHHQYGAIIKKNAQLFSINWQTTKNIYRLNVLVEIPRYHVGDCIKDENNLYHIMSLGTRINVTNLKTQKKTSLVHGSKYHLLKPTFFQVIKKYPEAEVLDPQTYYQARLMNPTEKLEINQTIKVVVDGQEAWMV